MRYRLPETLSKLMKNNPVTGKQTTQKKLAEYLGISPYTLSQFLNGKTVLTAKNVLAMADFFGVTTDYLLTGYENIDPYFIAVDFQDRKAQERLGNIAVLCSQAENEALSLMEKAGDHSV